MHDFVNFAFAKLNISKYQLYYIQIKYVFEINIVLSDD